MNTKYEVESCFSLLKRVTDEFLALDLKDRYGENVPRKLWKLHRHAEIFMDFPLMYYDEEDARRIRNRALTERRTYYEQSLGRTKHSVASQNQ